MKREQGWKNAREQGAKGKNVKGAIIPPPHNRASKIISHILKVFWKQVTMSVALCNNSYCDFKSSTLNLMYIVHMYMIQSHSDHAVLVYF